MCKTVINWEVVGNTFFIYSSRNFWLGYTSTSELPSSINACPKWALPKANLLHGIWPCPSTVKFWAQVVDTINVKMVIKLANEPQILLFHSFPQHANIPVVLHVMLMAVKRWLLSKWLLFSLPSMFEVVAQVKHYLTLDMLETIRLRNTHAKTYFRKWKPFIQVFLDDEEISQLMTPFWYHIWYQL